MARFANLLNRSRFGRLTCVLFFIVLIHMADTSFSEEIRLYEFVPTDAFTFFSDCGECSNQLGTRARVRGTFEVSLMPETESGKLSSIDIELFDVETAFKQSDGTVLWVTQPDRPFLDSSVVFDPYRPPLDGVLELVSNMLVLTPSGLSQGGPLAGASLFEISFTGQSASFNFEVPIIELIPRIVNAEAQLVTAVPESSSITIMMGMTALLIIRRS